MPKRVLYVFDSGATPQSRKGLFSKDTRVFLCPILSDDEKIRQAVDCFKDLTNPPAEVPYAKIFHQESFQIKNSYLNFISSLAEEKNFSGKNLKETFRCLSANFSLWWTSSLAEKSPLRSKIYNNLTALMALLEIREQFQCDAVYLDIENQPLVQTLLSTKDNTVRYVNLRTKFVLPDRAAMVLHIINGFLRLTSVYLKAKKAKSQMRILAQRESKLRNAEYVLVTYFPLMKTEDFSKGRFTNLFYGPLQEYLESKDKDRIVWLSMFVEREGYDFTRSLELATQVNGMGSCMFFLDEFLTLKDYGRLILEFLKNAVKFNSMLSILRKKCVFPGQNANIWPILAKDFLSSFCGSKSAEGLSYYLQFRNVTAQLQGKAVITHITEMQSWEKALNSAVQDRPALTTVGIQHTTVPYLLLNYFSARKDLEEGGIEKMPKPKRIACAGRIPMGVLQESGWNPERLFRLGALREDGYKANLEKLAHINKRNRVVVVMPISPAEGRELLMFIHSAFKDFHDGEILIKSHPFCPINPILSSLSFSFPQNIFRFVTSPINEILAEAKILIVTESTVVFNGLSWGCRIVVPRLPAIVDMNAMTGLSPIPVYVYSSDELRQTAERLFKEEITAEYIQKSREFLGDYFDFDHKLHNIGERWEEHVGGEYAQSHHI